MKTSVLLFLLICLSSCFNRPLSKMTEMHKGIYSQHELKGESLSFIIDYQAKIRDTVFEQNNLNQVKSFQWIEDFSLADWSFAGCFKSENKNITAFKPFKDEKIAYEEGCVLYSEFLDYISQKSQEELNIESEQFPIFHAGQIYYYHFENNRLRDFKHFPDFDYNPIPDSILFQ